MPTWGERDGQMTMVASAAFVSRRSSSAREPMVAVTDVP